MQLSPPCQPDLRTVRHEGVSVALIADCCKLLAVIGRARKKILDKQYLQCVIICFGVIGNDEMGLDSRAQNVSESGWTEVAALQLWSPV